MRRYEIMVILDPELEERTVAPSLETYLKIIKESGGTVDKLDIWGRRRMSFEINKKPRRNLRQSLICTVVRMRLKNLIAN